ncbi:unnamed protein product [Pleuronectes platessa]|uniref:Uncharacterized protein n=1 Tax=Pleuronectes platessa TaxID=8262 RepID=A0A9N7VJY4_PLEPL|nr:unnamed protein product [Pleuronectes platessa]
MPPPLHPCSAPSAHNTRTLSRDRTPPTHTPTPTHNPHRSPPHTPQPHTHAHHPTRHPPPPPPLPPDTNTQPTHTPHHPTTTTHLPPHTTPTQHAHPHRSTQHTQHPTTSQAEIDMCQSNKISGSVRWVKTKVPQLEKRIVSVSNRGSFLMYDRQVISASQDGRMNPSKRMKKARDRQIRKQSACAGEKLSLYISPPRRDKGNKESITDTRTAAPRTDPAAGTRIIPVPFRKSTTGFHWLGLSVGGVGAEKSSLPAALLGDRYGDSTRIRLLEGNVAASDDGAHGGTSPTCPNKLDPSVTPTQVRTSCVWETEYDEHRYHIGPAKSCCVLLPDSCRAPIPADMTGQVSVSSLFFLLVRPSPAAFDCLVWVPPSLLMKLSKRLPRKGRTCALVTHQPCTADSIAEGVRADVPEHNGTANVTLMAKELLLQRLLCHTPAQQPCSTGGDPAQEGHDNYNGGHQYLPVLL